MESRKYERTYHFPFSPGQTSDDKVQLDYWQFVSQMKSVVLTEKLDGENNCLSRYGVFARSHAAPTISPWTARPRQRWAQIRHDLGELEIFGENLYAVHSIEYKRLEDYFFVFGTRYLDQWLCWEEVCFCANALDLPVVPVLSISGPPESDQALRNGILDIADAESRFGSVDAQTGADCSCEGIVLRDSDGFPAGELATHVMKYVRKDHVQTSAHFIDLFTSYRARVRIVYVEQSYKQWRAQNRLREAVVPEHVMDRMMSKWEVPRPHEAHSIINAIP